MDLNEHYLAGLFDGEGWFSITRANGARSRNRREWTFQCRAGITMREKSIMNSICEAYGGTVVLRQSKSEKHSNYYNWNITGRSVLKFIEDGPGRFLVAKKEHASLIKEFQSTKNDQGNRALEDKTYEFYHQCFFNLKELNRKGVGKL